jgi:hypothetical protein
MMKTPITIGGSTAPDSEHARKAASLVERVHSQAMLNHVHRTWWFAEFLGRKRELNYDRELVYLASILHDLGLTEEFAADQRFEVEGADAASRLVVADGYSKEKADLVWQAIALHSSLGIADRLRPEIALVCMGAHVDVMGLFVDELSAQLIDDTLTLYPRMGFKAAFQQALAEVAKNKPHTTVGTGLADIGRRHVHGFSIPDVCDLLDGAPFDS